MVSEAIFNKAKFEVLGNPLEDVEKEICELNNYKNRILNLIENNILNKNSYAIQLLSKNKIIEIFKYNRIYFKNSKERNCMIFNVYEKSNNIYVVCKFTKSFTTNLWKPITLNRFLELYDRYEFNQLYPKNIREKYFMKLEDKLNLIESKLVNLQKEYKRLYKEKEEKINLDFNSEIKKHKKLESENIIISKNKNRVDNIKEKISIYLNSIEKQKLMNWISDNIYSIRLYAIEGGRGSGRLSYYKDFGNQKIRKPDLNEEGKLLKSCDSANGYISFKNVEKIPVDVKNILERITYNRNSNVKSLFNKNRLNDFNFSLYLLSEFNSYGFKSGIRNLNRFIDKSFIETL